MDNNDQTNKKEYDEKIGIMLEEITNSIESDEDPLKQALFLLIGLYKLKSKYHWGEFQMLVNVYAITVLGDIGDVEDKIAKLN